ncbi:glycosyltransferase [Massilia sp. R2A-15]|uniref:glycosyltransferase family protein n=1 Tax=Massilia sp. R2A-15 TaxID=3064278 RepID=UPI002735B73B|nr:glycosyltransferase [Massilia sp. R2A-15]WLI88019.1 glycosyltransferase [Massilia sp. R2A-15]
MKILFVGATWKGSSARSLREGLGQIPEVFMDEVGEDHFLPLYRSKPLRALNRLVKPWQIKDLEREITTKLDALKPDVLIIYKGNGVRSDFIEKVKKRGVLTVNVFPDYSPHAYGRALASAMGVYDLVISTKPFHPAGWQSVYGYSNRCEFVPHGYDPDVHFWPTPYQAPEFDVVLAASWRAEYHELMQGFANAANTQGLTVGLAGNGWEEHRSAFPANWQYAGPLYGRAYGDWVRKGRIVIAPVHSRVVIDGVRQPGDEDTTRTYELASAFCFFLHRRTPYASRIYDQATEVAMWDDADELARKVLHYLPRDSERAEMAAAAHARAVPAYSIPARASEVLEKVRDALARRSLEGACTL